MPTRLPVSVNPGEQWSYHRRLSEWKVKPWGGAAPVSNFTSFFDPVPLGYMWVVERVVVLPGGTASWCRIIVDPQVGDSDADVAGRGQYWVDGQYAPFDFMQVFDKPHSFLVPEQNRLGVGIVTLSAGGGNVQVRADGYVLKRAV